MRPTLWGMGLLACLWIAHAVPEESASAVGDLLSLVQEEKMSAHEVIADYDPEQFAGMMNKIIVRASKMRVVMNKLGISDTDSVKTVEMHFIKLGKEHADLGEGMQTEEELRLRGLQARSCVKHATSCSRDAAGCHDEPKFCKSVVEGCTRAAAACGINHLGESKDSRKKSHIKGKKTQEEKTKDTDSKEKSSPQEKPPLNPAAQKQGDDESQEQSAPVQDTHSDHKAAQEQNDQKKEHSASHGKDTAAAVEESSTDETPNPAGASDENEEIATEEETDTDSSELGETDTEATKENEINTDENIESDAEAEDTESDKMESVTESSLDTAPDTSGDDKSLEENISSIQSLVEELTL